MTTPQDYPEPLITLYAEGQSPIVLRIGSPGADGATGPQGIQGERGLQGEQGIQGIQGEPGPQGIQGERGLQGEQGIQGERGLQGEQGIQGERGLQGEQGIQGIQGEPGPQGIQGERGLQGEQGIQGERGLQGEQGQQGIPGEQGIQGERGLQGEQGIQGERGLQGEQGIQGIQGEPGVVSANAPLMLANGVLSLDSYFSKNNPHRFLIDLAIGGGTSSTLTIATGSLIQYTNNRFFSRAPDSAIGQGSAFYNLDYVQRFQNNNGAIDFSRKITVSLSVKFQQNIQPTDPNTAARFFVGMTLVTAFTNNLSSNNGFGFIRKGNQNILFLTKAGSNPLLEQDTGFNPVAGQTYQMTIQSLGNGTAHLYIDGVLVSTSTSAPSTLISSPAAYVMAIETGNFAAITGNKANFSATNVIFETEYPNLEI